MNTAETTKSLILKYFNSWRAPADFEAMRSCVADDLVFDAGMQTIKGDDGFTEMNKSLESPWNHVTLLGSFFDVEQVALFYEGIDKNSGMKTRVAEHITVSGHRIAKIIAVVSPLAKVKN